MRRVPLVCAVLGALSCSSSANHPDGAPIVDGPPVDEVGVDVVPKDDAPPVPADGPVADTGPERVDVPVSITGLGWVRTAIGDAGDPVQRKEISVDFSGPLHFNDSQAAPADATMTAAERDAFQTFLNRPGLLDELLSTKPCGPPYADYNEYLTIGRQDAPVQKEITACTQAPYEELRQLLRALIQAHFTFGPGNCPAPNIWRYMSPGCGANAHPFCGSPIGDACAAPRCSCDGRDIIGCDFTTEPYAYVGRCRDGGP